MTLLQRIINRMGFVSKSQMRVAMANFQAASIGRLTASWTTSTLSADAQLRYDLRTVRARSRELRDNNDYAQRFVTMLKTNVLGENGIHFRSKAKEIDVVKNGTLIPGKLDVYANNIIEDRWWKWGRKKTCTVSGTLTWCDVQKIVLENAAVDGEALIRKVRVDSQDNPFGFSLQILDAELLDTEMNEVLSNGNEVRMGVELDKWRRPVSYFFLNHSPDELFFRRTQTGERHTRIPANEIIHLFVPRRTDQTRGIPFLVTAAFRMNLLGKYEEAEVVAARASASKPAFFTHEAGSTPEYTGESDEDGNKIMEVQPGTFEQLPVGWDVKTVDWNHPNAAYQAFVKTCLRGVASGLGVSYNTLANDMESVNFASGKLGLEDERQMWRSLQNWYIENFCTEVFEEFLKMSLATREIPLPAGKFEKFNSPEFRGRTWDYINPQQEVTAKIMQLNAGLISPSRILAQQGIDIHELYDEIKADKEAAAARGLTFSEVVQSAVGEGEDDDLKKPQVKE